MTCTHCGGKCGPLDWAHERKCCPDCDCDRCGCDESLALRAELATVRAERDYLIAFCDASELIQMRRHLAAEFEAIAKQVVRIIHADPELENQVLEWERAQGHLAEAERSDFDKAVGP